MENYIYYFFAYFIEALILWQYCSAIFLPKRPKSTRAGFLFLLYTILSVVFMVNLVSINALLFFLANLMFIFLMFHGNLFSALFHAALTTAILGLSELATVSIFPNMAHDFYNPLLHQQYFILHMMLSKLIYFLLLFILSHILPKQKETEQSNKKDVLLILAIPFLSIWIIVTLIVTCRDLILPIYLNHMLLISAMVLLLINIFTWIIYTYTQQKNREFTALQLQLQREYDTSEYYKMLLKQDENQQILIHDMKKHLQSISILNEQGNKDAVTTYIAQIVNSSELQNSVRFCDNEVLNAILSRYSQELKTQQTTFHTDIRSGVIDFMDVNDITSLFCNLLENATEAASVYPNGHIELNVYPKERSPFIIVSLVNSCRTTPLVRNGQLISRKTDAKHHGFGIKSIQRIVTRYQGEMQCYYNNEDYTFHTIILLRTQKEKV